MEVDRDCVTRSMKPETNHWYIAIAISLHQIAMWHNKLAWAGMPTYNATY